MLSNVSPHPSALLRTPAAPARSHFLANEGTYDETPTPFTPLNPQDGYPLATTLVCLANDRDYSTGIDTTAEFLHKGLKVRPMPRPLLRLLGPSAQPQLRTSRLHCTPEGRSPTVV